MNALLERLTSDHANFIRLMYCFRQQLAFLEDDQGDNDDFDVNLILDILDYINTYPNHWHHPIEDVIFDYVLQKSDQGRDVVSMLKEQHQQIEQLTQRLESEFQKVAIDSTVPVETLLGLGNQYLNLQIEHLEAEENQIFPLIDDVLEERDWQKIEESTDDIKDPLFGSSIEKVYENLLDTIISSEADGSQIQYMGY